MAWLGILCGWVVGGARERQRRAWVNIALGRDAVPRGGCLASAIGRGLVWRSVAWRDVSWRGALQDNYVAWYIYM